MVENPDYRAFVLRSNNIIQPLWEVGAGLVC